jgi:hypothetical protein
MTNAKHTPGPWTIDEETPYRVRAESCTLRTGRTIASPLIADMVPDKDHQGISIHQVPVYEECRANARLIAAAPDLLAACERLIAALGGEYAADAEGQDDVAFARAVIAKATS